MINDLQKRFEEKAYQESSLYFKMTDGLYPGDFYRACIINFQNFAKSYPDSQYNEELAYKLVEVSSAYGERSVFDKKEERLKNALGFADQFRRKYPESKHLVKIDGLIVTTTNELNTHQKVKQEYDEQLAKAKKAAEEEVVMPEIGKK